MIKCSNCNKEVKIDFGNDIEATMWNFDGTSADIEMYVYCEDCEKPMLISVPATIQLQLQEENIRIINYFNH